MAGGNPAHLIVPSELVTLGGITIGLLVVSSTGQGLKNLVKSLTIALKGGSVAKADVEELLKLMYELFNTARRNGLIALEDPARDPPAL